MVHKLHKILSSGVGFDPQISYNTGLDAFHKLLKIGAGTCYRTPIYIVLPSFQIIRCFGFPRFITFATHLDTCYVQIHSRSYESRNVKISFIWDGGSSIYKKVFLPEIFCAPMQKPKNHEFLQKFDPKFELLLYPLLYFSLASPPIT